MKQKAVLKSDIIFPKTDAILAYMALRRAHDAIHRHVSKKLAQWSLSVPKYGVLIRLFDHGSLPISDLSSQIFRGNSNMTTLINRMEREGLVRRFNNGSDRRIKEVHLTKKGKDLAPKVIEEYKPFLHQMLMQCLTLKDQKMLRNMMHRIQDSLQNRKEKKKT